MKLILKEYLSSLRERGELDALLPDLLSQMGLNVFILPSRGTKEYGVDIAAVGSIDGGKEKLYLFSVKAGNLTRSTWNGSSDQALRPSLDEILDAFIPSRIPSKHTDKPIEICLCFGGDIESKIRQEVSGYTTKNQRDNLVFSEWNGDRLASLVDKHLLKEELLPKSFRHLLRKSLALLDEPEASYNYFYQLVEVLSADKEKDEDVLTSIRQLNLCLWILFSWCRGANNLEAAYLSSELTMLRAWDIAKPYLGKTTKVPRNILITLDSIQSVYQKTSRQFLDDLIVPHTGKKHALSSAVHPSCGVDVNLKMFDILSRLSLGGLWFYCQRDSNPSYCDIESHQMFCKYAESLKQLITNNPILFTPYKDDQAIDIAIAIFLLSLYQDFRSIEEWLKNMIHSVRFNFTSHSVYPSTLHSYHELIEHPIERDDSYQKEVTAGSILYPYISLVSALFGFDDIYKDTQDFKKESLQHCNFQFWYADETSEENFYTNNNLHGATLSDVGVDKPQKEFLDEIFKECSETTNFNELSAVKYRIWPIIILACRHFRVPLPVDFFKDYYEIQQDATSNETK